jgi:hypothetical protein
VHQIKAKEEQISYLLKNTVYLFSTLTGNGKQKKKLENENSRM